ncbi:hypothetical protein UFOVP141_45 [uncultured Caudovirales phage]|uniref:Uncharacterized protein n=1 Tax=uncultured Caudovirales phage TaxID=2100421 RepID=A0A6J7VKL1_9CAUD|nr:hypothetical protein UFOVP141_45 [uncultured Caudovirales phage]
MGEKISTADQLQELVDLDSEKYQLTDWEVDFIDSVERQVRAGRQISEKQAQVISKIYDAAFIHGKRGAR